MCEIPHLLPILTKQCPAIASSFKAVSYLNLAEPFTCEDIVVPSSQVCSLSCISRLKPCWLYHQSQIAERKQDRNMLLLNAFHLVKKLTYRQVLDSEINMLKTRICVDLAKNSRNSSMCKFYLEAAKKGLDGQELLNACKTEVCCEIAVDLVDAAVSSCPFTDIDNCINSLRELLDFWKEFLSSSGLRRHLVTLLQHGFERLFIMCLFLHFGFISAVMSRDLCSPSLRKLRFLNDLLDELKKFIGDEGALEHIKVIFVQKFLHRDNLEIDAISLSFLGSQRLTSDAQFSTAVCAFALSEICGNAALLCESVRKLSEAALEEAEKRKWLWKVIFLRKMLNMPILPQLPLGASFCSEFHDSFLELDLTFGNIVLSEARAIGGKVKWKLFLSLKDSENRNMASQIHMTLHSSVGVSFVVLKEEDFPFEFAASSTGQFVVPFEVQLKEPFQDEFLYLEHPLDLTDGAVQYQKVYLRLC